MRQLLVNLAVWLNRIANSFRLQRDRRAGHPTIDMARYVDDPFSYIEELRNHGAIVRTIAGNGWWVLGHTEFRELLRHPDLTFDVRASSLARSFVRFMAKVDSFPLLDEPWMLNRDPPDHTRLRKLSAIGFTHRFIEDQAPAIQQVFDDLLEKAVAKGTEFDFAVDIAQELPATVIANMLGVPMEDRARFRHWSEELLCLLDPSDINNVHRSAVASIALRDYLEELVETKRKFKDDDLITRLIEAEEDGDALTREEIYSTCALLLVAGHETTSRLLTTGLYLLLKHPDQFSALRSGEVDTDQFVEEVLRYEPPVLGLIRLVKQDFEAFGCQFRKGQNLLFSVAGANRDPRIYDSPGLFDIEREDNSHVSFGFGIHLCLGMSLTRMEARLVFNGLLKNFSHIELVREPAWGKHPIYRSPTELMIRCSE